MEASAVLNSTLSVISLLFVATIVAFFLRKSRFPYTVALVLVGLGIGYLAQSLPVLEFLEDFRLSPELVFYVFLPTLIFESAFHTNFKHFTQSMTPIVVLSTLGMLLSVGLIAAGTHYFLHIPWITSLIFGTLISATDPISVIAAFKKMGAPRRLSTIIEGESLFNDGTALVLFGILLEGQTELIGSLESFAFVVAGGLLTGLIMGYIFSKALDYVKNSKEIEISITLILAHATFIIAEYFLGVSGILATVAAGIVIGNYGAYKISPNVKEIMRHFWDYSAFLANSLLFLMVGLIIFSTKDLIQPLLVPLMLVIAIVLVARMLMTYTVLPLMNLFTPKNKIPLSWMHVIQWSGLRGALAIALILTLPEGFPFYEELLIFTVGVIFFTIIFNGLTIQPLLKFFGLHAFNTIERFKHEENQVLINQSVNEKLKVMREKKFISKKVYDEMLERYKSYCRECTDHVKDLFKENKRELNSKQLTLILKEHLLGIEKQVFTKLYYQGEITQDLLNVFLNNVEKQLEQIQSNDKVRIGQLTLLSPNGWLAKFLEKLGAKQLRKNIRIRQIKLRYEMYRARLISTNEALAAIKEIKKTNVFLNKKVLTDYEAKYSKWAKKAKEKLRKLEKEDSTACHEVQLFLAQKAAFHVEDKILKKLKQNGAASPKVYGQLCADLERRQAEANL
jgi:CPA1 family monovalent cation:H+ antiporter